MNCFALIDQNDVVVDVIVADQDFIDNHAKTPDGCEWVETDRDAWEGESLRENHTPLRKNFAGIGFTYDAARDAFIPPQPYPSWTLNETSCIWEPPVPYPTDGKRYNWNEDTQQWEIKD